VGELLGEWFHGVQSAVPSLTHRHGETVKPNVLEDPVMTDPDDGRFVAASSGGGVSTIIGGDRHVPAVAGGGASPTSSLRTSSELP